MRKSRKPCAFGESTGLCPNQSRAAPRAPHGAPQNRENFSSFFDFARTHPPIRKGRENFSVLRFLLGRNAEIIPVLAVKLYHKESPTDYCGAGMLGDPFAYSHTRARLPRPKDSTRRLCPHPAGWEGRRGRLYRFGAGGVLDPPLERRALVPPQAPMLSGHRIDAEEPACDLGGLPCVQWETSRAGMQSLPPRECSIQDRVGLLT